jgi:hypothetical protein
MSKLTLRPLTKHRSFALCRCRVLLGGLAGMLGAIALLAGGASADVGNYTGTLYLSGPPSSLVAGAYQLTNSPYPAPTATLGAGTLAAGTYVYVYTVVGPAGETGSLSTTVTVSAGQTVTLGNLPTGVEVRVYRQLIGAGATLYLKEADLNPNISLTWTDLAGASLGNLLEADNRILQGYFTAGASSPPACAGAGVTATCGYLQWAPGVSPGAGNTLPDATPLTPSGKGWIVDAQGGLSFPSGTWTFQRKTKLNNLCSTAAPPCVAHLVVGMWKVTTGPFASVQTLIDPNAVAAENATNLATASGVQTIVQSVPGVPAFALQSNEHLYVQFWRRQVTPMNNGAANRLGTLFADDGIASVSVDQTPNGFPSPSLSAPSDALRTNTIPALSASFGDPELLDAGTMTFQVCSDAGCLSPVATSGAIAASDAAPSTWTPSGPLSDGTYHWRVHAEDTTEASFGLPPAWTGTQSFTLDTVAPSVPALTSPGSGAQTNSSTLSATYSDGGAGDAGTVSFRVCSSALCSTVLASGTSASVADGSTASWAISPAIADGSYFWEAKATDGAANASAWSTARSVTLDTTPPVSTIGPTKPANPTNATSGPVAFSANETSTFACSLDGAAFAACTSPVSLSGLADGSHTFRVRATDTVGNVEPAPASYTWQVDTVPPDTSIGPTEPPALSNSTAPSFDLSATEGGSTFECSLDGVPFAACSNPKSYSGLADGNHTFAVRATDPAGNVDLSPASYTWTIDATPPDTTLGIPLPSNPTTAISARFSFSSEAGATFACSLDGAAFAACTSPQSYGGLGDGSHTFAVKATDVAGNVDPTPASHTWTVDTAAPVTSISVEPGSRTNEHSSQFVFTANEAVTGFDCSVDGAPFAGCSSPFWTPSLADGGHNFSVRAAADLAGNAGTAVSYAWSIDTTPPAIPLLLLPLDGSRTASLPELTATFLNSGDPADVGTIEFRLCAVPPGAGGTCARPGASGTSAGALDGATVGWTPPVLPDGTYYWQARGIDGGGNASGWSSPRRFTYDTTAPSLNLNAPPDGARFRVLPALAVSVGGSSLGETDTVQFELCADTLCIDVVASGSAAVLPLGVSAWTPPSVADGGYVWRVRAGDDLGNWSAWSPTAQINVDNAAPSTPGVVGPHNGAGVRTASLRALFVDPDPGDVGRVSFRLCADAACHRVVARGSSMQVSGGKSVTWVPLRLRDGTYFWQASSRDAAGNTSGWSKVRAITLDRLRPAVPRRFSGSTVRRRLLLRWQAPAGSGRIDHYLLFVKGIRSRSIPGSARSVTIGRFDARDRRSFALAAVDTAGNVGHATVALVGVPRLVGLTAHRAYVELRARKLVLRRMAFALAPPTAVVRAQDPGPSVIVPTGTAIRVLATNVAPRQSSRH